MSAKGQFQYDGNGQSQCMDGYETAEVAHYIHDMLGSLEAIAGKCEMDAVAKLLAETQTETVKHF